MPLWAPGPAADSPTQPSYDPTQPSYDADPTQPVYSTPPAASGYPPPPTGSEPPSVPGASWGAPQPGYPATPVSGGAGYPATPVSGGAGYPATPVSGGTGYPQQGYPQQSYPQQSYQQPYPAQQTGYPQQGYPQQSPYPVAAYQQPPQMYDANGQPLSDKSKIVAGVLGIALGGFGAGRFYTGHTGIAVAQLLVSIFTCGLGHFWGLIDGIMILANGGTDAQGRTLRES